LSYVWCTWSVEMRAGLRLTVRFRSQYNASVDFLCTFTSLYVLPDIRVSSKDASLNVTYYGRILQSTGEDWKDARIVRVWRRSRICLTVSVSFVSRRLQTLSTASPSVGGTPPKLTPARFVAGWKPQPAAPRHPVSLRQRKMKTNDESCEMDGVSAQLKEERVLMSKMETEVAEQSAMIDTLEDNVCVAQPSRSPTEAASAVGSAATFLIDRAATIDRYVLTCPLVCKASFSAFLLSDEKPHKVVIGVFDVPATFRYSCVPKQAPQAYVQAICRNTSAYMMLASDSVNVFVGKDDQRQSSCSAASACA
jgi:hypothetical protein